MAVSTARDDEAIAAAVTAIVALVRAIVREEVTAWRPPESELLDQNTSGLGRRHHCRAWREGKLRGRKVGRRILVTREDRDCYVEKYGIVVSDVGPLRANDIRNPIDRELAVLGFGAPHIPGDSAQVRAPRLTRRTAERTSGTA